MHFSSKSDQPLLGDAEEDVNYSSATDEDAYSLVDELECEDEDDVYIEVKTLEKNSRRIESRIPVDASLDTVWNILTDYERLADFIPNLVYR